MQPTAALKKLISLRRLVAASLMSMTMVGSRLAAAAGFDKIEDTVININTILVTISIAVVTIAIIWAGFKMIFQGARLADVANVLIGGTLVGGAAAFAGYIVA
jgi:type IV secretion system protein VirB2